MRAETQVQQQQLHSSISKNATVTYHKKQAAIGYCSQNLGKKSFSDRWSHGQTRNDIPYHEQTRGMTSSSPQTQVHLACGPFWQQFQEIERLRPAYGAASWRSSDKLDSKPRFYYKGLGWFHESLVKWVEKAAPRPQISLAQCQPSIDADAVVKHVEEQNTDIDSGWRFDSDSEESVVHSASETTAATETCSSREDSTSLDRGMKWISKRRRQRRKAQKAWQTDQQRQAES